MQLPEREKCVHQESSAEAQSLLIHKQDWKDGRYKARAGWLWVLRISVSYHSARGFQFYTYTYNNKNNDDDGRVSLIHLYKF